MFSTSWTSPVSDCIEDNARRIAALKRLRDQGNTVIVVEHDEDTMGLPTMLSTSDRSGRGGGDVVATGRAIDVASLTAR